MDIDLSRSFADLPFGTGGANLPDLAAAMAEDPALDELVRGLAALAPEDAGDIVARVEAILLRWTGADGLAPDSRGPAVNARWLAAMEAFAGTVLPAQDAAAAAPLVAAWNRLLGDATARLLGQTELGRDMLPGLLSGPSGPFQAEAGASLAAILAAATQRAPADAAGRLGYWRAVADSLVRHGAALGATRTQVLAALDPVLAAQGVGLAAADLLDALFAHPAGGGWAVDDPGNRLLIAMGGNSRLGGGAGDDRYIVTSQVGTVSLVDGQGADRLELRGWTRAGTTVTLRAVQQQAGASSGSMPTHYEVTLQQGESRVVIPVTLRDGQVDTAAERLVFDDGPFDLLALVDLGVRAAPAASAMPVATAASGLQIGGDEANTYVFGRGQGHVIVKEQGSQTGPGSMDDVVALVGLNRADVSFARAAYDPVSIVMTIHDTGETLTLDGTPFDALSPDTGAFTPGRVGAQGVDRIVFADGTALSLTAIGQAILDSEGTAGADWLEGFGGAGGAVLDGGGGNDTYRNRFSEVAVRLAAGSGSDRLINSGSGPTRVTVSLSGLEAADLLVLFERRDGHAVTVLRARSGEELVIDGRPGSDGLEIVVLDSAGSAHAIAAQGAVLAGQAQSGGDDYLVGTGGDDAFRPGKGNDVIAGRGGSDSLVFDPGDGADRLLRADQSAGTYILRLGAGIAASDLAWSWLNDGSQAVRLSFAANGDSVTVDARHAGTLAFADGTTLRLGDWAGRAIALAPGGSISVNPSGDDSYVASFGAVQIAMGAGSGTDRFRDASLSDAGGALLQPPAGWKGSTVVLEGGSSLDDFAFVRDSSAPANLVIRNLHTGSSLVVEGQFASEILLQGHSGWLPADGNSDGVADWPTLDLDGDGASDFARLDADGDGQPDWDTVDFDGDGQSDWQRFTLLTLDADGDGAPDVYAYDADGDRRVDTWDFVLTPTASQPNANGITFRDSDGDGQADAYSTDYATFTPLPRDAGGAVVWAAIDSNRDGLADTAALDSNGDGLPEWQSPDRDGDGKSDWRDESIADLYDPSGRFVASQKVSSEGQVLYQVDGGSGGILARDSDGDGRPDAVARDADYDFRADPLPAFHPVESLGLTVRNPDGTVTRTTHGWNEIATRLVLRDEGSDRAVQAIDLFAGRPAATAGNDVLVVRAGETVDGLAGNDRIHAEAGGAVIRFGRGSGSDTVLADLPQGGRASAVVFGNIQTPAEIELLRSPGNPSDLVVRIRDTGEELRIAGQWRQQPDGSTLAMVDSFTFASGERLGQAQILALVSGAWLAGDDILSSGPQGGVLDGGAGADRLWGGEGDDLYRFGRGYGADRIGDAGGSDCVEFAAGIAPSDLAFARTGADGGDLRIVVAGEAGASLTLAGQFLPGPSQVETFRFVDGTVLTASAIEALLLDQAATSGDDLIHGFGGADLLRGLGGNDRLSGLGDDDVIEGGTGRDTAVYRGSLADYEVTTADGVTTVTDRMAGRDGSDVLRGVEELYFAGGGGATVVLVAPNRAPEARDLAESGSEDTELVIAPATLLAMTSDPDGDSLELSLGAARNGQVWFSGDGSIRFRPATDFHGFAGFDYTVSDGNGGLAMARVVLSVAPVNDAPVFSGAFGGGTGVEDQPLRVAIPAGLFSDVDGDTVALAVRQAGGADLPEWLSFADGLLSGTPPADFNGALALELAGSDGMATTVHAFTVLIDPVNDAPRLAQPLPDRTAAMDTAFSLALPAGAFVDADGDGLTLSASRADGSPLPAWLAFDPASGTFSGRPGRADIGTLALVVQASDPSGTSTRGAFTLTVASGNTAPMVSGQLVNLSAPEGSPFQLVLPAGLFTDPDPGDRLSVSVTRADGSALPGWLRFDAVTGTLFGTPRGSDVGAVGLAVRATDRAGASARTGFVLTVSPVNDAPVAGNDILYNVANTSKATMLLADLFANDSGADGDALTLVRFSAPSHGTATRDAQGSLVYTPKRGFTGADSMTYTISDGRTTATATIAITVVGKDPYAGWRRGKGHGEQLTGASLSVNRIYGAGGNDTITGGTLGDFLAGGNGDDVLRGLSGNDFLEGNDGNDVIDGGAGVDTAVFSGLKASYSVRTSAGKVQIVDTAPGTDGNDGCDTLIGVEKAVFRNGGLLALAAPVVLDLDGDGVELVARSSPDGVQFDWDGDGRADPTGWVGRDDGFLVLDRNGDGTVTDASELGFVHDRPGARSDLDGLTAFDSNGDGLLSADRPPLSGPCDLLV